MKKLSKVLFASLIALSLLVACGGGKTDGGETAGGSVKIGVASTQVVAVDEDGKAAFDTVVVGVALEDDKVSYVSIDHSQQSAVVEGGEAVIEAQKTKKEKKEDYNMKDVSPIGKEWYEQIEALETELVGKTKDEVTTYLTGDDVKTAATIQLGEIEKALVKAIDSAVAVEGAAKVGLGYHVSVSGGDKDAQSVLEYAMIAVDADGKIVKALLDNAQEKALLEDGKLVAAEIGKTKGELKDAYDMKKASPIEKEWNEQNDALMEALVGKTIAEATELKPGEGDIESSVTIHIDGVQAALKAAEANLK